MIGVGVVVCSLVCGCGGLVGGGGGVGGCMGGGVGWVGG